MTHAYLLNKSIAHNKYLIPLLYLLNDAYQLNQHPRYYLYMMNKF